MEKGKNGIEEEKRSENSKGKKRIIIFNMSIFKSIF